MFCSQPKRSITTLQLLTQLGLEHGLDLHTCLEGCGLTPLQLADTQHEIEPQQELRMVANLTQALAQITDLGLQAGLRYQLTTYGIWGYAMLSSQSFRQAAELGLRYLDLTFALTQISLSEDDEYAHLHFADDHLPSALRDFLVLRDSVAVLVIQRELTSRAIALNQVHLRMPAPADPRPFIEQFGVLPHFASTCNRISFARALLDEPLPRANPAMAKLCEEQCQALLAKRRVRSGLAGQVRDLLLRQPGYLPDMEQVAKALNLSSRTLRRRLLEQGSSFRQLQEEVRQTLAEALLSNSTLSQAQIAERLGYSEAANFLHAFKRWKGQTPQDYRRLSNR